MANGLGEGLVAGLAGGLRGYREQKGRNEENRLERERLALAKKEQAESSERADKQVLAQQLQTVVQAGNLSGQVLSPEFLNLLAKNIVQTTGIQPFRQDSGRVTQREQFTEGKRQFGVETMLGMEKLDIARKEADMPGKDLEMEAYLRRKGSLAAQKGKEINDEIQKLNIGDQALTNIENAANKAPDIFGPVEGRIGELKSKLGSASGEFIKARTDVRQNVATVVRNFTGAQASDRERKFLEEIVPKMTDSPSQVQAKIQALKRFSQQKRILLQTGLDQIEAGAMAADNIRMESETEVGRFIKSSVEEKGLSDEDKEEFIRQMREE